MAEKRKENKRSELLRELIGMYQPQSVGDITDMLKDLFADTMEDMLQAELEAKLGYRKNDPSPKETGNRRNGSYPKTVRSGLGESRIQILHRQYHTLNGKIWNNTECTSEIIVD